MKTKHISETNANYLLKVLNKAKELNSKIKFMVLTDDGELIYSGKNPEKLIEKIDGYDCDFGINCVEESDTETTYAFIGWFFVTPYEEDEDCIICDYSDNDFCVRCVKMEKNDD